MHADLEDGIGVTVAMIRLARVAEMLEYSAPTPSPGCSHFPFPVIASTAQASNGDGSASVFPTTPETSEPFVGI
jgi:hypothetical protein